MAANFVLSVQITIMILSIIFNGFGIFTFRRRTKGNKIQHLLLQNLAAVEISKTVSDFVPLLLYYLRTDWYNASMELLMVIEMNVMTMLYLSFVAVTVDRLLCVILQGRYTMYVKRKSAKVCIAIIWIGAIVPGVLMWAIFPVLYKAKMWYYVAWDVMVVLVIVPTYVVVFNQLRLSTRRMSQPKRDLQTSTSSCNSANNVNSRSRKSLLLGILLTLSFIVFNLIPDVAILIQSADMVLYYVVAVTWSTGYLVDPVVYIFASKYSRHAARSSLVNITNRIGEKLSFSLSSRSRAASSAADKMAELAQLNAREKHGPWLNVRGYRDRCISMAEIVEIIPYKSVEKESRRSSH